MTEHDRQQWEVTDGKLSHVTRSGKRVKLRPGDRFHPTTRQIENNSLVNVARPTGGTRGAVVAGADVGLRALSWGSDPAKAAALEAGLTVEEMEAVGPSGETGYIMADVRAALEVREEGAAGADAEPTAG